MKTKDFIKMLQEEDPTGEGYLRFGSSDEAIVCCEAKDGYWDGMYSYYDPDTKIWHKTTNGYKVDIHFITWDDIVWECYGDMDKIRKRLNPDYSSYSDKKQREEKYEKFWKNVEEEALDARETFEKLNNEMLQRVLTRFKEGWSYWTLDKPKPMIFQGGKWKKRFKKESAVFGEMEVFLTEEHLFEKIKKGKFINYKLK
jgi:hypothetical protein